MLRKQECRLHRSASQAAGLQLGGVAARLPAEVLPCPTAVSTQGRGDRGASSPLSGPQASQLYSGRAARHDPEEPSVGLGP